MNPSHPTTQSVAKALIVNQRNEVLILTIGEHRAQPDRSFMPDLPGGLVDPGESETDAVVREIAEETAITVSREQAILVYAATEFVAKENTSVTKALYLIHLGSSPDITLSWEHSAYEWIPVSELLQRVALRPFYKLAVEYSIENKLVEG